MLSYTIVILLLSKVLVSSSESHPKEPLWRTKLSCEEPVQDLQEAVQWGPCTQAGQCINKSQICNGRADCKNGRDESPEICNQWVCEAGVRCERDNVCIYIPHQTMCLGSGSKSGGVCRDGSDQKHCTHTVYSGKFISTDLGRRITNGSECFCDLRDGEGARLFYRSMGRTHKSSHILGTVCIGRSNVKICDGYTDCVNAEDEDPELCHQVESTTTEVVRGGRELDLEADLDLEEDYVEEVIEDKVEDISVEPFENQTIVEEVTEPIQNNTNLFKGLLEDDNVKISSNIMEVNMLVGILAVLILSAVGCCVAIIYIMIKLSRRKNKEPDYANIILPGSFERQVSTNTTSNVYVSNIKSPIVERKPTWSLRTTSIVKELGRGYYSKVYLAQDANQKLVAVKTGDGSRTDKSRDCIANEIEILSTLPPHQHLVKMIGQNTDEKLIALEYCFHGNLKDYLTRNRDYYVDELDPLTREIKPDTLFSAKDDTEDPMVKRSKCLVYTRRLLHWSYQISQGMRFLWEEGIIHRDVALRNILLTNNDIVKISDFGLAAKLDRGTLSSPNKSPQYHSRSNKPQPYKWMAPESFIESVFSSRSDVWGFGVALWEMFSLGKEPYGETNPTDLHKLLLSGGRLQDCRCAPRKINELMKDCWSAEPHFRPDFNTIVGILSFYMGIVEEKKETDLRSRTDSGVGDVYNGYLDMNQKDNSALYTSDSISSASKFSTRSRESTLSTSKFSSTRSKDSKPSRNGRVSKSSGSSSYLSSSHQGSENRIPRTESAARMYSVIDRSGGEHRKIGGSSAQLGSGGERGNSAFHKIRSESIGSIQRNGSIGTILTHDGSLCSTPYRETNSQRSNNSSLNLHGHRSISYWSNYKIVSGSAHQVGNSVQHHVGNPATGHYQVAKSVNNDARSLDGLELHA